MFEKFTANTGYRSRTIIGREMFVTSLVNGYHLSYLPVQWENSLLNRLLKHFC